MVMEYCAGSELMEYVVAQQAHNWCTKDASLMKDYGT